MAVIMDSAEKRGHMSSLSRVEGHTKGIKGMVHGGRCISDILLQLSAVRAGIVKTQLQVLKGCLGDRRYSVEELKKMSRVLVQPPSRRVK
ncbi:MAG: metal-sensitive transcriptional regulator [Candidatus Brocadiales bacterium]